jgi:drug/metabolite transporter (DMT)-like permease
MTWFLIALVGPIFYAITNHIDKHLLDRYFKEGGVGTLMLFSSLLSVLALPFIVIGDPTVFSIDRAFIPIMALVSLLNIALLWFYLLALKDDETSVVIVFYQLVPVFGYLLGYFILGETLGEWQLLAMAVIIFGTSLISFEIDADNHFVWRSKTVGYMLIVVFCWALESVIFKAVALEENVWRALFWEHIMMVVFGGLMYAFIPFYRKHFLHALRTNSRSIISLNVLNEGLYMFGNIVVSFAYLMAPIALVLLTESFQPIFVFVIGIFLTILFPKLVNESMGTKQLVQKGAAIMITIVGTYLLLLVS